MRWAVQGASRKTSMSSGGGRRGGIIGGGELAHVAVANRTGDSASPTTVVPAARLIHLSARAWTGIGPYCRAAERFTARP